MPQVGKIQEAHGKKAGKSGKEKNKVGVGPQDAEDDDGGGERDQGDAVADGVADLHLQEKLPLKTKRERERPYSLKLSSKLTVLTVRVGVFAGGRQLRQYRTYDHVLANCCRPNTARESFAFGPGNDSQPANSAKFDYNYVNGVEGISQRRDAG